MSFADLYHAGNILSDDDRYGVIVVLKGGVEIYPEVGAGDDSESIVGYGGERVIDAVLRHGHSPVEVEYVIVRREWVYRTDAPEWAGAHVIYYVPEDKDPSPAKTAMIYEAACALAEERISCDEFRELCKKCFGIDD